MRHNKKHVFLSAEEQVGAYTQIVKLLKGRLRRRAYSTVARQYGVTDGTLRDLVKNVTIFLEGGTVEKEKNRREFERACWIIKTMPQQEPLPLTHEPVAERVSTEVRETITDVRKQLDGAYNELCKSVANTVLALTNELRKENDDLRNQLETIADAVVKVKSLQNTNEV